MNEYEDLTLWIARDEDGSLFTYLEKPKRIKDSEPAIFNGSGYNRIDEDMYPEVTFENSPQPLITPITAKQDE